MMRTMIDAARLARIDAALAAGDVSRVVDDACAMIDEDPASRDAQRAYLRVLLAWARGQPGLADRTFPLPSATHPTQGAPVRGRQ